MPRENSAMHPSRRQQLEHLLALSTRMLSSAQSADWVTVTSLDAERQRLLTEFFAMPPQAVESPVIADLLGQAQTLSAKVMALGEKTQRQVAAELCGLGMGRKVVQAYNSNR